MNFASLSIVLLVAVSFQLIKCQTGQKCVGQQNQAAAGHSSTETPACECAKLEQCLSERQKQIEQFQNDCSKSCGTTTILGENITEILDCFAAYESNKRNQKSEIEKCFYDLTGKPCTGDKADKHQYTLQLNLTGQTPPTADQSNILAKQTLASIKNHPLMNPFRKCFKQCMKRSPIYTQPTVVGEKVAKQPSCYEQSGCVVSHTVGGKLPKAEKALKNVAKNNCALQVKSDKTALKVSLAECLQKAFSNRSAAAAAACEKPHTTDEL